jgi:hypothetical protein
MKLADVSNSYGPNEMPQMKKSSWQSNAEIKAFIRHYVDELTNSNAAVFAGAGLSVASGYVDWRRLLKGIADELGLDVDRETNLVAVAQYHVNERHSRSRINQRILDEFSEEQALNDNHRTLARLPISTYWTTNYDRLIETALQEINKVPDVKYTTNQLRNHVPGRNAVVYKMHGDAFHPDSAVITKDDYEGYFREHEAFVTALSGDLVSKTLLFLGFSFSDPNIDYILSRVRVTLRRQPKQHYCIMRREKRQSSELKKSFEYRKRQQSYLVNDLARLGVQTLLIDEYEEITEILGEIERHYRRRSIFISGSAHDYDPWRSDTAQQFISDLSSELVKRKFNLVTGFGLGVGPAVISGAMQTILGDRRKFKVTQVTAMPFPVCGDERTRKRLFSSYRQQIVSHAGIAIFLFGNKRGDKEQLIEADGVHEEFRFAVEAGLAIVAIGATGSAAKNIWETVCNDFLSYFPNATSKMRSAYKALGDSRATPEQLKQRVIQFVALLNN